MDSEYADEIPAPFDVIMIERTEIEELPTAPMTETEDPSLDEFVDIQTLQTRVAATFPTVDAVRWYVRQNRAALVEEGALIIVAGRLRFNPPSFKLAVVSIGQRQAARRLAG